MTRPPRLVVVLWVVYITLTSVPAFAQGNSHKIDQAVGAALSASPSASQRVIITTQPGSRTSIKQSLKSRGNTVIGENAALSALTAQVNGPDIALFANSQGVLGIHADADVRTNATPASTGTAPAVSALRATLGLTSTTYTGAGIGIA